MRLKKENIVSNNPFAPPTSNVDSGKSLKPGSIWKGIVIGGLIDFVGTTVFSIILFIVYMALHNTSNLSPDDIQALSQQYTKDLLQLGSIWGLLSFGVGSGLSLLGGYVCARFAKERWKTANTILGIAMAGLGLFSGGKYYSLGANLSLGILTFAIVYAGGWLREGRHVR